MAWWLLWLWKTVCIIRFHWRLMWIFPFSQLPNKRHFWEMDWKMYKADWRKAKLGRFFLCIFNCLNQFEGIRIKYNNKRKISRFIFTVLFFLLVMCHRLKSCAICQPFARKRVFRTHMFQVAMIWALQWVSNGELLPFWFVNMPNIRICSMNLQRKSHYYRCHGKNGISYYTHRTLRL